MAAVAAVAVVAVASVRDAPPVASAPELPV
jgi:hypothetical protein